MMRPVLLSPVAALAFTLTFVVAVTSSAAHAAEPCVSDGGAFFGRETLSEAEGLIRAISDAYRKNVVVETYPAIPESLRPEFERSGKEKFYEDWLNRRARERGVRGVFILMTREPGRVQVGVDAATRRRIFTVADRETLREILASAFRARQFDRGLLDGLRFVGRRMGENTAADRSPTVPVISIPSLAAVVFWPGALPAPFGSMGAAPAAAWREFLR